MSVQKYFISCIAIIIFAFNLQAQENSQEKCETRNDCKESPGCQCYCSEKGGFRNKVLKDKPIFLKKDKNNVHCYCKKWDLKKYPGPATRD
jgi:hypothetical protein